MQKTCDVAEKAILAKINLRKFRGIEVKKNCSKAKGLDHLLEQEVDITISYGWGQ